MLRSRDQFLTILGYEVDGMSDKAKSRTAQTIVKRAKEQHGFTVRQVNLPGTRSFRYHDADIDRLIELSTLTPAAA